MTWIRSGLHVALAVSLGANLILGIDLWRTQASLTAATARPSLAIGDRLADLELRNASGQVVTIKFSDQSGPTVVYVTSPTCRWCIANRPNLRRLASEVAQRYRFVGIALDRAPGEGLHEHQVAEGFPFDIYEGLSSSGAGALLIRSTPSTVVVSATGVVEAMWEGAFTDQVQKDVERFFGVSLPGLADQEKE